MDTNWKQALHDAGYRVHFGGPDDEEYAGLYWWSWTQDGIMDISVGNEEFATEEEAWKDAASDEINQKMGSVN